MAEYVVEFGKDGSQVEPDGRLNAAAFHRNHEAIWAVLGGFLQGKHGDVFEAGSGTGQHTVTFARQSPDIQWWPSDFNEAHLKSIAAWRVHARLANVHAPRRIDLSDPAWPLALQAENGPRELLAVFCANVIHIAPWIVTQNLMRGAGRALTAGGHLLMYGPYKRGGAHTAPSNEAFDTSLRGRNPDWGVRDLESVADVAAQNGLALVKTVEMPANNLVLAFERG